MSYAKEFRYNEMKKAGDTEHNLEATNKQFEYEVSRFKKCFIKASNWFWTLLKTTNKEIK